MLALGQVAGWLTQAPCVSSSGRYAVFGLGSSMYPQFCAFAHDIDQKLSQLGASQLAPTGEGDELSGQEEAFRSWAVQTFKVSSQQGAAPSRGQGGCGVRVPQTPVPGILGVTTPIGPCRHDPSVGRLEDSGRYCTPTAPRRAPLRHVSPRWEKVDKMLPCPQGAMV